MHTSCQSSMAWQKRHREHVSVHVKTQLVLLKEVCLHHPRAVETELLFADTSTEPYPDSSKIHKLKGKPLSNTNPLNFIFYPHSSKHFNLHIWPWIGFPHVARIPSSPTTAVASCQTVKNCSPALNSSQGGHRNPLGCPYQLGMQSGGSADPGGSQADCAAHPQQETPL